MANRNTDIKILPLPRTDYHNERNKRIKVTSQLTVIPVERTESTSDGRVEGQNEHCTKAPSLDSLPTELVIKILGLLPLDELLLNARLVNRMWNLLSTAQLASWTLSLRHAVTGDIEILYHHELVVVYQSPSLSVSNEVKVIQQKTLSLSFDNLIPSYRIPHTK